MVQHRLRGFLLKEKAFGSRSIYKRAVLRGQLSLLGLSVGVIYTIIDYSNHLFVSLPFYFLLIVLCGLVFLINRTGKFSLANFIFLPTLLFLLYAFADNDTNRTGVSGYLIVYSLIALTLCGYEQLKWGIFFCGCALLCFFAAYFVDLPSLIRKVEYSQSYITISFITNFVVSLLVGVALLFFSLDINYRTEQELSMNNQLLIKANRELDRFVYSASHDLRAPLSSLLGLIEISQRSNDQEEIKQCLAMMKIRVNDLDSFIKDIIDFSRNARQDLRKENFNLLQLVKEVTDGLKFGKDAEEIAIVHNIDSSLQVNTDRSRLKVVFNNLVSNAMKYSDPNKTEKSISINGKVDKNLLKVSIEDNGIGIAKQHLPKIFEMFYRASEKSQGSGLGLYIVKETLDRLSGIIHVTSSSGIGSVFEFEIPIEAKD